MITPNDIATKTFKKVAAGYSPEEVDSFLDDIYEDYERMYKEKQSAPPQPIMQELPVPPPISKKEITAIEKALEKTLLLAEQTAVDTKEVAVNEAAQIVKEARFQAEEILKQARTTEYEVEQKILELENKYELMRTRVKLLLYAEIELLDKNEILSQKEGNEENK